MRPRAACGQRLKRGLFMSAGLAAECDPARAALGRDAVGGAAFAANRLNARVALFHDKSPLFHGFADQPLGLLPHRLLRHRLCTCPNNPARTYRTDMTVYAKDLTL